MKFKFLYQILLSCFLASGLSNVYAKDVVRYVNSVKYPDPKQSYFVDLLTLALEASKDKYGDYKLAPIAIEMAQARTSIFLQKNELIDLHWRMTSQVLEQKLQAIYFPILKGLMGYRIFIIRNGEQSTFNKNMSLKTLKNTHLGQGQNWPDTEILIENGFSVVREHIYSEMLT